MVEIIGQVEIDFYLSPNPVDVANQFIRGELEESTYQNSVQPWWDYLAENGLIRSLETNNAVIARFAIYLLSVDENSDLDDHLSWFFEVLRAWSPALQLKEVARLDEYSTFS